MKISRRAWLRGFGSAAVLGLLTGGTVWRKYGRPQFADLTGWTGFSADAIALMDEIGECIIPTTDTPGAKAVQIGQFMALVVTDCFDDLQRSAFLFGLADIDARSREDYGRSFLSLTADERTLVLSGIQGEQRWRELWNRGERGARILVRPLVGPLPAPRQTEHYLTMLKSLTVHGYFTSEIGATQALRHSSIPGAYDGCLPYKPGDRAWSL
jgi:hypothetical protein